VWLRQCRVDVLHQLNSLLVKTELEQNVGIDLLECIVVKPRRRIQQTTPHRNNHFTLATTFIQINIYLINNILCNKINTLVFSHLARQISRVTPVYPAESTTVNLCELLKQEFLQDGRHTTNITSQH